MTWGNKTGSGNPTGSYQRKSVSTLLIVGVGRCVLVQVLNETSGWWFDRAQHITQNAVVSIPDPNVTIARKCSVFPVEFVGS